MTIKYFIVYKLKVHFKLPVNFIYQTVYKALFPCPLVPVHKIVSNVYYPFEAEARLHFI
jgi:hypothetical protein